MTFAAPMCLTLEDVYTIVSEQSKRSLLLENNVWKSAGLPDRLTSVRFLQFYFINALEKTLSAIFATFIESLDGLVRYSKQQTKKI